MLVTKQWWKVTILGVFMAALLLAAFAQAPAAHAKGGDAIRITLSGSAQYPNAKGTAKYKVDGGEREFQVEVENIATLAGTRVSVYVNGTRVGTAKVTTLGTARLSRNTDLGQVVPNIVPGSRIQVKSNTGVLIVSGRF